MKLGKPKSGKFAPTCASCKKKFQLLIKEMPDGSFRHKAAPLKAKPRQVSSKAKDKSQPSPKKPADQTKKPIPADTQTSAQKKQKPESGKPAASKNLKAKPKATGETVAGGRTDGGDDNMTVRPPSAGGAKRGKKAFDPMPTSGKLGPYRLIKLLGQGGMGSVYLAKQTTLDRNVALKVVRAKLAKHASMIARFTREAYAAAQLVHPNVVQIYDMGDDDGNCYFSMELVEGNSLLEYVNEKKKLDPEEATSFILHAARGLECAHNAGMVHRDIKPANLLVTKDGVVKVADLGLVKVPDSDEIEHEVRDMSALSASQDLTQVGTAIGTPYYMAPEQAKNAIDADHRSDIYSLGCTYYVLLTGKRPFEGNSIEEVVSKHTSQPLVMPSRIVERVPTEVSAVVAKMMAKRPEDRYQSASALISDLENHLGLPSAETFTPMEVEAEAIETSAKAFNASPLIKIRPLVPMALVAGSILLAILLMFVDWRWGTGFVLFPLAAIAGYFVFSGTKERGALFTQVKDLVMLSGWLSWLKWAAAGLLLLAASFLTGTLLHWIVLGGLGAGIGIAYYFLVDGPIAKTREEPIKNAEVLIRRMRLKGLDESIIQTFVAKYCGNHWEEFFEHLFGYENKRKVREEIKNQASGKKKPKFRAWRDGIYDGLNKKLDAFSNESDQKHLQKIEQAGLEEAGLSAAEAKAQAEQMAAALVDHGESVRVAALQKRIMEMNPEAQRLQKRMKIKAMLAEARSGKYKKPKTVLQKLEPYLNMFLGSYARFLIGCCLIVGCLLWARQNGLFEDIADSAQTMMAEGSVEETTDQATAKLAAMDEKPTNPLSFPIVGSLFFNFNSLIAGLILVFSTMIFGWRMSIFALPAAFITLWGASFGIPEPYDIVHVLSALIGIGIFVAGMLFGRTPN